MMYTRIITLFSITISQVYSQFNVEVLQQTRSGIRRPVERCEASGATFGADVASFSFGTHALGCGVVTRPDDACSSVTFDPQYNVTNCSNYFAIVPRGQCNFSEKAFWAQKATPMPFSAIIIYNEKGQPPVDMKGGKYEDLVRIPVLMVTYACMEAIIDQFPARDGYLVQIRISPGYYDLFRYLIPFVVVVCFCFVVLLVSLAIRLVRERRRIARKRLSKRNLKKIPTKKYRKGEEPDTCAICLDEFMEGEKLRVLPCRHTYHCACIDPWLTQNRKVCPMCKRRVGAKRSDSESSDEERHRRQPQPSTSTSTTSILRVNEEELASHQADVSTPGSPAGTVSSVLVDVHVHHNVEMSGSREQLVDDAFLNSELDSDVEGDDGETTLSQSLKKRLKGFFNRSGAGSSNSDANVAEDSGRVNGGFDNISQTLVLDGGSLTGEGGMVNSAFEGATSTTIGEPHNQLQYGEDEDDSRERSMSPSQMEPNYHQDVSSATDNRAMTAIAGPSAIPSADSAAQQNQFRDPFTMTSDDVSSDVVRQSHSDDNHPAAGNP